MDFDFMSNIKVVCSDHIKYIIPERYMKFGPKILFYSSCGKFLVSRYAISFGAKFNIIKKYIHIKDTNLQAIALFGQYITIFQIPDRYIIKLRRVMPKSASANLISAVEFGMTSWTPFATSDVYFACAIVGTANDHSITVELRILPKPKLEEYVQHFSLDWIYPDSLLLGDEPTWEVALPTDKRRDSAKNSYANYALLVLAMCGFLLLTTIATFRQYGYAERLREAQRSELELRRNEADLKLRIETLRSIFDGLTNERSGYKPVTQLLNILARELDSGAAVVEIDVDDNKLNGKYIILTSNIINKNNDNNNKYISFLKTRPLSSSVSLIEFNMKR